MTWWSEHSAVPRFVFAKSAIRCRFVDRFAGFRAPSRVSGQRFSTHGASLPSAGSRRARFPAFTDIMKALRLPLAQSRSLMASVAGSTRSSIVRARRGAPDGLGGRPPGLEQLVSRRSFRPVASVDANGISQVPWRSVPCLCPAPGPRSSRRDLACGGLVDAAPGFHKPKASAGRKISRLTQGFSIRCLRFTSNVAATHARLASGWRAAPLPGGRRTLWTAAKGFRSHFPPPFQDLPCRKRNVSKWDHPRVGGGDAVGGPQLGTY